VRSPTEDELDFWLPDALALLGVALLVIGAVLLVVEQNHNSALCLLVCGSAFVVVPAFFRAPVWIYVARQLPTLWDRRSR
jgi:membrane-bound ClpP family serine protease